MGQLIVKHKTLGERYVYFDDTDHKLIMNYKWVLHESGNTIYCIHWRMKKAYYMHRIIMNPKSDELVDHRDRNGLNNRRYNLRVCSSLQNQCNRRIPTNNKTGFIGVSFNKLTKRYRAQIGFKRRHIHIGMFKNPYDAATAYNQVAIKLHGEFASLNLV